MYTPFQIFFDFFFVSFSWSGYILSTRNNYLNSYTLSTLYIQMINIDLWCRREIDYLFRYVDIWGKEGLNVFS